MTPLLERIDARLAELGISRRKASILAGLGQDYLRNVASGKNKSPSMAAIESLARALDTTVENLRGTSELNGGYNPPKPLFSGGDLPLYRSVEGGPGQLVVTNSAIGFVDRPASLASNADAFAVVVSGESMSPEYEPGDRIYVDPYKPLVRNRNFIFIDDRHGDWKACVKRLLSWDVKNYHVKQHNPTAGERAEFTLKKSEWTKVYRVIGKIDPD